MGRSERQKGSRGEREFINTVKDELGDFFGDVDKNWNQREESRWDVLMSPWAVEIKRHKDGAALPQAWREAADATEGTEWMPLLAYRLDFKGWMIQMSLVDMFYLMTGEAMNLIQSRPPSAKNDWHTSITYTVTMPLEAWFMFCREYVKPLNEQEAL